MGKGSLSYVWQLENQTLVNETRPDLIIKGVKESDQGAYRCRVTSAFGSVFSNLAVLKLCEYLMHSCVLSGKLTILHTYNQSVNMQCTHYQLSVYKVKLQFYTKWHDIDVWVLF